MTHQEAGFRVLPVFVFLVLWAGIASAQPGRTGTATRPAMPGVAEAPPPQAAHGRMHQGLHTTHRLVVEGVWGYPCRAPIECSLEDSWLPVSVGAWLGDEFFPGRFIDAMPDRDLFEVEIQVLPVRRHHMVMLEVVGESQDGRRTRFRSILRTAATLLGKADAGGRVADSPDRPQHLTSLTTAVTAMLQDLNGGDWRMGEGRLRDLARSLDPERIVTHAMVFHGLNTGVLPPHGDGDSYGLLASRVRMDGYLQALPEDAFVGLGSQFSTLGLHPYLDLAWDDAMDLALVPVPAPGTVVHGPAQGVRLGADNPWTQWAFLLDTGMQKSPDVFYLPFQRAGLRIVRPGGVTSTEVQSFGYECPGMGEVEAIRLTRRMADEIRRVWIGPEFELFEFIEFHSYEYLALDDGPVACAGTLPGWGEVALFLRGYRPAARLAMPLPVDVGRVALALVNPDPVPDQEATQFVAGHVDFATGAVDVPGYAGQGIVDVDGSGLRLQVAGEAASMRNGLFDYRFDRVMSDAVGAEMWMFGMRLSGSSQDHVRALATPVVPVQAGLALVPGDLQGMWHSGVALSRQGLSATGREGPRLSFDPIGAVGAYHLQDGSEVPFSWSLEDNVMRAQTFQRDSAPGVLLPLCPDGVDDCRLERERTWEVVRTAHPDTDVRRLHMVEDVWETRHGALVHLGRHLNFYDAR